MTIVCIFAERLFSFKYLNVSENEYDRLMDLWTNVEFLTQFAVKHDIKNTSEFIDDILRDAEQIQDFLDDICKHKVKLDAYFEPLQETERKSVLSLQKGKIRQNRLRLYALKIDMDCYVITGGAVKNVE